MKNEHLVIWLYLTQSSQLQCDHIQWQVYDVMSGMLFLFPQIKMSKKSVRIVSGLVKIQCKILFFPRPFFLRKSYISLLFL